MAIPTGTITLVRTDTNQAFFSSALDANGNYSISSGAGTQVPGTVPIQAQYSGDATHNPSVSPIVNDVANTPIQNTTTTLAIAPNPGTVGQNQTFTGSVS